MLARLRASLTYANVMATVAVFVALGGTSYAVATGSIGTRQLKNNAVRSKDIRNNDVRSIDVRDRSLLARDFKAGQLPAGPAGAPGPQGPKGDTGLQGDPGMSGYVQVDDVSAFNSDSTKSANAFCPAGTRVVGGGAFVNASGPVATKTSVPRADGTGWVAEAYETLDYAGGWNVDARAICVKVAP
jgi:hypothetical protein